NLIYLCSLGDPAYRQMTELCIRSLRRVGKYGGDILVFSNNGFKACDGGVGVVSVPGCLGKFEMTSFKTEAARSIKAETYDKILWIDSDMLAIDEVSILFRQGDDHISAMEEEPWTRMSDPPCGECLSEGERQRGHERWGINTGLLCIPRLLFRECME